MPFEFDGEKYSKVSSHQMEWGERLIAELNLSGNEQMLDLGCGDGSLTAKLSDVVPQGEVVGIDASYGMLEAARRNVRANLRFELLDINDLSFENRFDDLSRTTRRGVGGACRDAQLPDIERVERHVDLLWFWTTGRQCREADELWISTRPCQWAVSRTEC